MRLLSKADYQRVFDQATKSSDRYFTVLARSNELNGPRLGLAIAKKSLKHAVQRNRVKRLSREAVRLNQISLAGVDFIVMARPTVLECENSVLSKSLGRHLQKLSHQCAAS